MKAGLFLLLVGWTNSTVGEESWSERQLRPQRSLCAPQILCENILDPAEGLPGWECLSLSKFRFGLSWSGTECRLMGEKTFVVFFTRGLKRKSVNTFHTHCFRKEKNKSRKKDVVCQYIIQSNQQNHVPAPVLWCCYPAFSISLFQHVQMLYVIQRQKQKDPKHIL